MDSGIIRRVTREIRVGQVAIGGNAPVSVQSMTNTFTEDAQATIDQIHRLENAGCEIVRLAIPNEAAAEALSVVKSGVSIPIIADIHFDYRLAIAAARFGADALRINPGNIGGRRQIQAVVNCARDHGIPIRIGVNSGSLEKDLIEKHRGATVDAMVESAMRHISVLESMNFEAIKVSIKTSNVGRTVAAYRRLSQLTNYPLHLGVTEAGTLYSGIVKSALGIGMLLSEGIGDTLRVSLTRDPVEEVRVGYEILKALNIRRRGPEIISCPTCGRCRIDLFGIVEQVEKALENFKAPIKIAIMGCVVNGPGEAREADIGIAGGDGIGVLFKKGRVVEKFPQEKLVHVLMEHLADYEDYDNNIN